MNCRGPWLPTFWKEGEEDGKVEEAKEEALFCQWLDG